jgi:UDP-N-acetyl-D-glucosamine dehydrogenase
MEKLEARGATVDFNDPNIPKIPMTREHAHLAGRKSSAISGDYDLFLISTNHKEYYKTDFSVYNTPIVDTRNCANEISRQANYYKA